LVGLFLGLYLEVTVFVGVEYAADVTEMQNHFTLHSVESLDGAFMYFFSVYACAYAGMTEEVQNMIIESAIRSVCRFIGLDSTAGILPMIGVIHMEQVAFLICVSTLISKLSMYFTFHSFYRNP
jgi:hypothetical protein